MLDKISNMTNFQVFKMFSKWQILNSIPIKGPAPARYI